MDKMPTVVLREKLGKGMVIEPKEQAIEKPYGNGLSRNGGVVALLWAKGILAALVICAAVGCGVNSVVPSNSKTPTADTWKVYTNVRFQYSICYPQDFLIPQGEAENSDGQAFLAKDGAKLIVFGRNNALNEPLDEAMEDSASRLAGTSGKVTHRANKPDWFVISGENGQSLFYAKTLYAHEQFKTFELTYDRNASAVYNAIITRLEGCFASTAH